MIVFNIFSISGILITISSVLTAVLLFVKGSQKITRIWGWLCLLTVFWGFGGYEFSLARTKESAFFWWQISYITVIFSPVLYSHFVFVFLKKNRKIILSFEYFLAFIFLLINFLRKELFIGDLKFAFNQFYYIDWLKHRNHLWLIFYIIFYWFILFYPFILLVKEFRISTGIRKQQLKYFILGSLAGWLGPHGDFLPVLGVNIYPYSNFLIAVYPLIFTYAIIRYRLMDITLALTRSGIFILVYSIVLGIPLFLIYGWQNELASFFGVSWWIVPYFCTIALSTLGPFIYFYINERAEARLLREQRSYQKVLRGASSGMIRIKDLNRLLNLIVRVVAKTVRIKHVLIYLLIPEEQKFKLFAHRGSIKINEINNEIEVSSPLVWQLTNKKEPIIVEEQVLRQRDDPHNITFARMIEQLKGLKASLVVPSFIEDRLIGVLVLGEKRSGKLYSQDDITVFSVLANQAALAIENAQFYNEIKQTHEQLFQAEKMATIGTMADGLSHQINNRFHALSLISGDSLDILKTFDSSGCSDEAKQVFTDLKSALERIEANVLQGGEIVKGLLKYSRPGEGGFEQVDFKSVIGGAIDMVQYKIKLKEIDIVQNLSPDLPKLHGNLTQLQEVFFNMIDNAYDAIKERHQLLKEEGFRGKIAISANSADGAVEIIVQDNGMGVKEPDKKKLFTPFFTTKATAKKGTGLGLYVIEKIIASHNGKLKMDSVYQSGTTFRIILPISAPAAT